jgi:hypothetical protein
MTAQRPVSCMVDGDTFIGTFTLARQGSGEFVTTSYQGRAATAPVGAASVTTVAQRLLAGLVRDCLAEEMLAPAAV